MNRIGWCSECVADVKKELSTACHILSETHRRMIWLENEAMEGIVGIGELHAQWRECLNTLACMMERMRTFSTSLERADQLLSETEKRLIRAGSLLESGEEEKLIAINGETRAGLSWMRPPAGAQRASEADYEARFGNIHFPLPQVSYCCIRVKTHPADTVDWEQKES